MRWKATKSELIWKREFATRAGAIAAAIPQSLSWLALLIAYAGLAAILYVPKVPLLDVLSPLTGHLLGLAASAILALLIGRRSISILAAGVVLTVLAHALPAYLPGRTSMSVAPVMEAQAHDSTELKVMAFNVWFENRDPDLMARVIEAAGADVVVLSEVTPEHAVHLERLHAIYPYTAACTEPSPCGQRLLSKIPFASVGALPATRNRPAMVWAELVGSGVGGGITVVGTHLHRPTRSWSVHVRQRDGLIDALNQIPGPLVVGGDFNITGWTRSFQEMRNRAGLSTTTRTLPSWPAYPLALPQFGIDHILVRGLSVREAGVGPYGGSDHLPVWSKVSSGARAIDREK